MDFKTLPDDYINEMEEILGAECEAFLAKYKNAPWQALRFNRVKKGLTLEKYADVLSALGVQEMDAVPWAEDAFYYKESDGMLLAQEKQLLYLRGKKHPDINAAVNTDTNTNIDISIVADTNNNRDLSITASSYCRPGKHPYHDIGLYYIQEPSAMAPAVMLDPQPGERVLDLCAAPGGKSTQLASAMRGEGLLVANEIHPARAKILSSNIERMGITNALVTNEDSAHLAQHFPEYFHRILVDAPCSGEGMFRKNPEAIAEWSRENVHKCAARQAEILDNAASMLMPGGTLVYSTCTFSKEEDEDAVRAFLERHPEFALIEEKRLWPHQLRGEGHYAARLQREGRFNATSLQKADETDDAQRWDEFEEKIYSSRKESVRRKKNDGKNNRNTLDKTKKILLEEFLSESLTIDTTRSILGGKLLLFGEQLYRLPDLLPELAGLRVLRPGLHIGTFRKNRFEPSHALALSLGAQDVKQMVNLSTENKAEADAYLRGESFSLTGNADLKGWTLINIDGYSAGWGKASGGIMKNHYPKGLR